MRKSIGRPARALLPLVLGAAVVAGDGGRAAALAWSILICRLCALGAASAFQGVSGKVVSEARLRGNLLTALLLALAGGAAGVWVLTHAPVSRWAGLPDVGLWMALTGALVMLTELFSERLYALTDKLSAPFCDAITAVLVGAGLFASRGDERILFYFTLAALGACLIAGLGIGGFGRLRPGARVLAEIPRALFRAWLPTAILVGILVLTYDTMLGIAASVGWALFSWAYAPVRRTEEESGAVAILTTLFASAAVLLAFIFPQILTAIAILPVYVACLLTACFTARLGDRAHFALLAYTAAAAALGRQYAHSLFFGFAWILDDLAAAAVILAIGLVIPDIRAAFLIARARGRARRRRGEG